MAVASTELMLHGEQYSLSMVPREDSKIVVLEKDKMLGTLNLRTFVKDLGRVGEFIRVAYNGVGAAGPKFIEQQIEIQKLGYDITKICDKSALTVASFKKSSSSIITDLQCSYGYLLDDLVEMALDSFDDISKVAEEMHTVALELTQEFDAAGEKVKETLFTITRAKGKQETEIDEKKKMRSEIELEKEKEKKLYDEYQERMEEAEKRRRALESQEDEAISEIGTSGFKDVVNALTSRFIGVKVFNATNDLRAQEDKAKAFRKSRLEAIEAEAKIRKERRETLEKMTQFAIKIQRCEAGETMANCAVQSLHEALGVLRELSSTMMRAAQFWDKMRNHCQSIGRADVKSKVETALKYETKEQRLHVWTSRSFKTKAIQYYAEWVALFDVCNEVMEQIKYTQADLYKYITENPTYEESRVKVRELATSFLKGVEKDQKALDEKEHQSEEEKQALISAV